MKNIWNFVKTNFMNTFIPEFNVWELFLYAWLIGYAGKQSTGLVFGMIFVIITVSIIGRNIVLRRWQKMRKDVLEELEERDAEWQKRCDGWIEQIRAQGNSIEDDTIKTLRNNMDRRSADEIKRLRKLVGELQAKVGAT